jgi:putative transposase
MYFEIVFEPYRAAVRKLNAPFNRQRFWRKVAKTLDLSPEANRRLEWMIYYHTKAEGNASLTIRHFGLHRSQFYYWLGRFDESNLRSLENESTAPIRTRQKEITSLEEQRIIRLRREHMCWGKMKLKRIYEKEYGQEISSWKIQYTVRSFKLYPNPKRNARIQVKRKRAHKKRKITELKRKLPVMGYLLHFDTIVIYWGGLKRYIITMIDDYTKLAFARMYRSKSSMSAQDFLLRVDYLLDGRIQNAHSDNGSEFEKYFEELSRKLSITRYWSRPRTPTDNPSLERFNQTLQREWLNDGKFTPDVNLFNSRLKKFVIEYNFVRPHEHLEYLTPIEFAIKHRQLSERYSSCTRALQKNRTMLLSG